MAAIAVEIGPVRLQQELQQAIVELPDRAHLLAVAPDRLRRAVQGAVHREARGVVLQPLDPEIERAGPAFGEFLVVLAPLVERAAPELGAVGGDRHRAGAAEMMEKGVHFGRGHGRATGAAAFRLGHSGPRLDRKKPASAGPGGLGSGGYAIRHDRHFFFVGTC